MLNVCGYVCSNSLADIMMIKEKSLSTNHDDNFQSDTLSSPNSYCYDRGRHERHCFLLHC